MNLLFYLASSSNTSAATHVRHSGSPT